MKYYLKEFEPSHHSGDSLITFNCVPNVLEKIVGIKPTEKKYLGSVTVWYEIKGDNMTRCGTLTESWLCDVYKTEMYKLRKND